MGLDPSLSERWSADVPFSSDVAYAPSGRYVTLGSWERGVVARVN